MEACLADPESEASDWASALRDEGYCVVPSLLPARQVEDLDSELAPRFARTPFARGPFSGPRSKRFHGLLKRSRGAAALVAHPLIVAIAEQILLPFCDSLQLNLTQAIELHPGAGAQVPHRDQDMWAGEKGRTEYLLNIMWPLTPFTAENGGTVIWPGSHRSLGERLLPVADSVSPEIGPGDALLFLGSTLHGGGANRTFAPRRGIIVSYCLGWLKPYENMWLTYPPEVARDFPAELRDLVGYRRHRPNLGNYDGQCPSVLFEDDVPDFLAVTDALVPEQQQRVEQFVSRQEAASPWLGK
ncbi:MAG TPA: phytanoyl-CoA dioxygenase family protein [Allosphingosinicella sp.]|jgi:ectoine hydroxylase-related dioxygenase (phytanoyl-CoA dioxygenase family)